MIVDNIYIYIYTNHSSKLRVLWKPHMSYTCPFVVAARYSLIVGAMAHDIGHPGMSQREAWPTLRYRYQLSNTNKLSISMVPWVLEDRVFFKFSQDVLNLRIDFLFVVKSFLCFLLNSWVKCWTKRVSKSSPPNLVSPAVAFTSNTPSSILNNVTSNVPPPRS